MVVVTHEMSFARRVGDWVAVFDAGRIVEQGPPQQIFDAPHDRAHARFPQPSRLDRIAPARAAQAPTDDRGVPV